ncbi:hypothetical protein THASP1DRAFT_21499 [Thamnocephalis sphaerospora]|uniref:Etoposide-induced protein 2.4-domain-containing protein n=1 Tax=Thamnocephalis sphaerospora TaxID=78915 RepID=A0A4P9XWV3_9FUNG|nr:hypothetical protein THASP1DRAFT_21499 [Thamnocephalis sphaerospora]|eukprot:RKP10835.1 hypothetical protein THASP1DRAFT_21499 [Thamnocephalis sphaerospora]
MTETSGKAHGPSNAEQDFWQHAAKEYGRPFRRVVKGISLLPLGAARAYQSADFRRTFRYALLAQLASFFLMLLLTQLLIVGPLTTLRTIISWTMPFTDPQQSQAIVAITTIITTVQKWTHGAPLLLLLGLRYAFPTVLDRVFMSAVTVRDPALGTILAGRPYIYRYWEEFRHYLKRSWRRLRWLLAVRLAQLIPFVGPLVTFGVAFYMTRRGFGRKLAILNAVLVLLIPNGRAYATMILELALGSRQLVRELLEPFFCRMDMDARMRREWFRHRNAASFGFGVLVYLIMLAPWTNLLVFLIAQSAVVELVATKAVLSKKDRPKEQ